MDLWILTELRSCLKFRSAKQIVSVEGFSLGCSELRPGSSLDLWIFTELRSCLKFRSAKQIVSVEGFSLGCSELRPGSSLDLWIFTELRSCLVNIHHWPLVFSAFNDRFEKLYQTLEKVFRQEFKHPAVG